jgi:ABC-type antimicrobial peptide transport system permease subunit
VFVKIDRTRHTEIAQQIVSVYRSANYDDRQAMFDASLIDPLTVAGWRGMTILSLIMTGAATVLGYLTYLLAHESRTRHDTGYMRAIGLSRWEFLRIVMIEHFLIGIVGVVLGVVTGLAVSRIAVSSMAHTATGRELIPPFILQTEWLPTVIVVGLAVVTAAVILLGIIRAYPRLPLHVLTRTSE